LFINGRKSKERAKRRRSKRERERELTYVQRENDFSNQLLLITRERNKRKETVRDIIRVLSDLNLREEKLVSNRK
jgi:hypothetical protein